jgi:hypothetical protein
MSSTNPNDTLTSAEVDHLNRLEAIVLRGVDTDLELGNALAEISEASLYRAPTRRSKATCATGGAFAARPLISSARPLGQQPNSPAT